MRGFLIGIGAGVVVTLGLAIWAIVSSFTVVLLHNAGDLPVEVVAGGPEREFHSGWLNPGAWRLGVGQVRGAPLRVVCTAPNRPPTDNALHLAGGAQLVRVRIHGCGDIRWRHSDLP